MKPLSRSGGELKPVKKGFDADSFIVALQSKGLNPQINTPKPNRDKRWGEIDHLNGRPIRFPENQHYMAGYNSYEPLIITRRCGGKKPQYTLADVDYQAELTGLPEWFNSPSEAIYYARAVDNQNRLGFGWRISEYHKKNKTFEQRVFEDSKIKPDVTRLYQSTITGELSTSIDNGKTWFDGGIMSYPLMSKVSIRELHGGGYRAVYVGWDYDYHYVTRTFPHLDELKKGSFKLKKPRPIPPKFDAVAWRNSPESWWNWHLEQSEKHENKPIKTDEDRVIGQCAWDYFISPEIEISNPDYEKGVDDCLTIYEKTWRCPCYHAKVAEYEKAVKKYELALEKWQSL